MVNLNDWSVSDLLDLYQRLEANARANPELTFLFDYDEENGWSVESNINGDRFPLTSGEADLILFFTGMENSNQTDIIHLYQIAGHFRNAVKSKLDEAIPAPPSKWYKYIRSFRTNWTVEDQLAKTKKNGASPENAFYTPKRVVGKVKGSPVPFPPASVNKRDDPPF